MNSITVPWMAEVVLLSWRAIRRQHRPPLPSELLATFVVFGTASLVSNRQPTVAATFGWGIVIATALNVMPGLVVPATVGAGTVSPADPDAKIRQGKPS